MDGNLTTKFVDLKFNNNGHNSTTLIIGVQGEARVLDG
jgi:hypothetical protein